MFPTSRNVKNLSNQGADSWTFETATAKFLEHIEKICNYSQKTILAYAGDLKQVGDFLTDLGLERISEVTPNVIADVIMSQREAGKKPQSINRCLSALRSLFEYLCRFCGVSCNPTTAIKNLKTSHVLPLFITESKMDELIDHHLPADTFKQMRTRVAIVMFYHTGIRCQEMANLMDKNIDLQHDTLKVVGKGNKERYIPFGQELKGEIMKYLIIRDNSILSKNICGNFLRSDNGQALTTAQIRVFTKMALLRVVPKIYAHPHVLRHTFATALMNHGASIEAIKLLLGHESVETTAIYEHVSTKKLQSIYKIAFER